MLFLFTDTKCSVEPEILLLFLKKCIPCHNFNELPNGRGILNVSLLQLHKYACTCVQETIGKATKTNKQKTNKNNRSIGVLY